MPMVTTRLFYRNPPATQSSRWLSLVPKWGRHFAQHHFVTRKGRCAVPAGRGTGFAFIPYEMERKTPYSNSKGAGGSEELPLRNPSLGYGNAVWIAITAAVSLAIVTLMATYL